MVSRLLKVIYSLFLSQLTFTEGVVVIAATNTPGTLDSALVRPGRFDKQVYVPLPDVSGRKQLFDLYLKKVNHSGIFASCSIFNEMPILF